MGALQRLLWCQTQFAQQRANRAITPKPKPKGCGRVTILACRLDWRPMS